MLSVWWDSSSVAVGLPAHGAFRLEVSRSMLEGYSIFHPLSLRRSLDVEVLCLSSVTFLADGAIWEACMQGRGIC
jgi:hypothetical protein